jgi:hypothetical protein
MQQVRQPELLRDQGVHLAALTALAQRAQIQVPNGTNLTNENFRLFHLFQSV